METVQKMCVLAGLPRDIAFAARAGWYRCAGLHLLFAPQIHSIGQKDSLVMVPRLIGS